MSNTIAIPAVTASIVAIVQARMNAAGLVATPSVAPGTLDSGSAPCVAVHLYRVERNGYRDNEQLATRASDGQLRQTPRAALDLHYLLAFHGTDEYETHRLMAIAAAGLAATPDISRALVASVGSTYVGAAGNDLADADELVRVTPESISVDEISRLWALYQPDTFRPTLGYSAGPVIVDADETPGTVLPVAGFALGARPLSSPRLDAVAGPDGPGAPITASAAAISLSLLGAALAPRPGEALEVLIDGVSITPVNVTSDSELTVQLPSQRPGVHRVQVLRLGAPIAPALSMTRPPTSSATVNFTILPKLVSISAPGPTHAGGLSSGTLTVDVEPALDHSNRIRILLDSQTLNPPIAVAIPFNAPAGPATTTLHVPFSGVAIDSYRVTLEVEGVRSIPALDSSHHYQLLVVAL